MNVYSLSEYRDRYGSVFVVELPDGLIVPFSLLSISDYFKYQTSLSNGVVSLATIEDEIFRKCVKDEVLVDNIYKQKAGTPTVVADTILRYSAPKSAEELQYYLNFNRQQTNHLLYQIICSICMGFPAYTPDILLQKDINELMFLLALAERKMLESGFLKEPLAFFNEENPNSATEPQKERKKPKIDPEKLKQAFEAQKTKPQAPKVEQNWNLKERRENGESKPSGPIVEDETTHFDDKDESGTTQISMKELAFNLNADPTVESPEEKSMLKQARLLYGDYIDKMQKGEKIKIKDVDTRIEEAKKRVEENRQKLIKKMNKVKK